MKNESHFMLWVLGILALIAALIFIGIGGTL